MAAVPLDDAEAFTSLVSTAPLLDGERPLRVEDLGTLIGINGPEIETIAAARAATPLEEKIC
jgi:hypothetical protein